MHPKHERERLGERHELKAHLRERLEVTAERRVVRQLVQPGSLRRWGTFTLVIAAALTFGQVGSAALERWSGPRVGARCVEHRDCGDGESCLKHLPVERRYCTRSCDGDRDCPLEMRCGDVATLPEANRGVGAAGPAAASSACIRQ